MKLIRDTGYLSWQNPYPHNRELTQLPKILKVAIPVPLYRTFDYAPPENVDGVLPGCRVKVPFGRTSTIGIVIGTRTKTDIPDYKIKRIQSVLDTQPILDGNLGQLLEWATDYYHHPIGEVYQAAVPALLRQGKNALAQTEIYLPGSSQVPPSSRAKKQTALVKFIAEKNGATMLEIEQYFDKPRSTINILLDKGLIQRHIQDTFQDIPQSWSSHPSQLQLNKDQRQAVLAIPINSFGVSLLHGVTGSGKTEVYLNCLKAVLAAGQQALVLVPEISLTPQLIERFESRFEGQLSVMHSGLTGLERLRAWQRARAGHAPIVLGTRSAVFAPMKNCGVIVVDEEHDPSFKQQEGFRYSARDLAVYRARQNNIPIILGSATPALESLRNAELGRYQLLSLPKRTGSAGEPTISVIDLNQHPAELGFSTPLLLAMKQHLASGNQVLLFLNRRGFAPVLFCTECGWIANCSRCDANMTVHLSSNVLRCHHCGKETRQPCECPECSQTVKPIGQGTQRIEQTLAEKFPEYSVTRIDRDSTQQRGSMERKLEDVASGKTKILLGTQMLTKGHDFGRVTLVAILDGDQGLFGTDFRSNERFAQTVVQVAGRAGRAEHPGQVLIQTHFPKNPLLTRLIDEGYTGFAKAALEERKVSGWPPFSSIALLRASATGKPQTYAFLNQARYLAHSQNLKGLTILGPAPAPMEKRAGRFRAQILIQAHERKALHQFLRPWILALACDPASRKVRWSIDVDPMELF